MTTPRGQQPSKSATQPPAPEKSVAPAKPQAFRSSTSFINTCLMLNDLNIKDLVVLEQAKKKVRVQDELTALFLGRGPIGDEIVPLAKEEENLQKAASLQANNIPKTPLHKELTQNNQALMTKLDAGKAILQKQENTFNTYVEAERNMMRGLGKIKVLDSPEMAYSQPVQNQLKAAKQNAVKAASEIKLDATQTRTLGQAITSHLTTTLRAAGFSTRELRAQSLEQTPTQQPPAQPPRAEAGG